MPVIRTKDIIRGPSVPLRGHVNSQKPSAIKSYSHLQTIQHKKKLEEWHRSKPRTAAHDELDFGAYLDLYNDSSNADNGDDCDLVHPEDSPTHGENSQETVDEWEDIEDEETQLYKEATAFYRKSYYRDSRSRRNKIHIDQLRWSAQIEGMTDAYMDYCYRRAQDNLPVDDESTVLQSTRAMDIFGNDIVDLSHYKNDLYISSSLIRQGYFPCNPLVHKSVISIRTLELYHHLFVRCPRLSIQPFVRGLCELQGLRFMSYLCVQLTAAYDAFRAVRAEVQRRVRVALGREDPNWRSLNACPACQYPTVGEPELEFDLLAAMDGNDSLKRVERRDPGWDSSTPGQLKERYDPRVGGDDYFMDPQQVDQWDFKNWPNLPGWQQTEQVLDAKKGCEDRWENMKRSHTETERGIFDETGVFVASCRHMFVIWILDMIKTGEQRKYALAFLHRFLSAIHEERTNRALPVRGKKAFGYDIGCQFDKTLHSSPLQSLAKTEGVKMLIGSLHGHAHNRRCQLKYLLSYIEGCGLEDLEVLERLFSQSNALASAVRHASKFHRRQMISAWMYHHDNFESYANLSKFIYNNYKQALSILATQNDVLSRLKAIGVQDAKEVFHWLDEEWEYLETREEEPEEDQNKMDLYMRLVKLKECQTRLDAARNLFLSYRPTEADRTRKLERTMRQEQEREEKLMAEVHILEERLDIKERWSEDSNEWKEAAEMIFELSKMHMAGTGYKMRRHLGKALKNRSKAIQEAVSAYNSAAAKLSPPRDALDYDDVVEKAYLSELDFLKDTRSNVRDRIWAVPANRVLMAQYFKLYRAWEELDRLHIEIKRLLTYMKEEKEYLLAIESHVATTNPHLAYQISLHQWERARYNDLHRTRLRKIYRLPGFDVANLRFFRAGVGLKRQSTDGEESNVEDDLVLLDELEQQSGGGVPNVDAEEESEGEEEEQESQAEIHTLALFNVANDHTQVQMLTVVGLPRTLHAANRPDDLPNFKRLAEECG
ncbi:hypothetical protein F5878DRAFT_658209 [Lentinula raphanica]|uniref:CxC2-like cysteine cluster KDZ transposase-associated domain-containing protein n=1 Tax=Lentinula raphanica TaxID=153919 RepID=A0AA38UKE4_9AGAR|nr:hypothetical protein F5878DRAFT_658209 [Lentinula raphanica]